MTDKTTLDIGPVHPPSREQQVAVAAHVVAYAQRHGIGSRELLEALFGGGL